MLSLLLFTKNVCCYDIEKNQGVCWYSFYSSTCKNTASLNVVLWNLLSFLPKSFSFLLLLNLSITFPVKSQLLEGVERENTFLFLFIGCIRQVEFFPTQRLVWWEAAEMRISTNYRAWGNFASEKKNKTIQKILQTGLTIQFMLHFLALEATSICSISQNTGKSSITKNVQLLYFNGSFLPERKTQLADNHSQPISQFQHL